MIRLHCQGGEHRTSLSLRPTARSHSVWQGFGTGQMWVLIPDPPFPIHQHHLAEEESEAQ